MQVWVVLLELVGHAVATSRDDKKGQLMPAFGGILKNLLIASIDFRNRITSHSTLYIISVVLQGHDNRHAFHDFCDVHWLPSCDPKMPPSSGNFQSFESGASDTTWPSFYEGS
jgi:hypothetical protein